MYDSEQLLKLFPSEGDIPPDYRPIAPIHQSCSLIDGVLKQWEGKLRAVRSPICIRRAEAELEHRLSRNH